MTEHVRTRTAPEVKWVANELAAVMGELDRIDETLARLTARKAHLLEVRAALSSVAGQLAVPELPDVMPSVRAHERYGARGSLRNFLREVLAKAYPKGVTTAALTEAVVEAFGLYIAGPDERNRLRKNSVRSALKAMHGRGEVEPVHGRLKTGGSLKSLRTVGTVAQSGVWRLKVEAPSMEELRKVAAEVLSEDGSGEPGDGVQMAEGWPGARGGAREAVCQEGG